MSRPTLLVLALAILTAFAGCEDDAGSQNTNTDVLTEDGGGDTTTGDDTTTGGDTTTGDTTAGDATGDSTTGDATGDTTAGDATGDSTTGDTTGDTTAGDTTGDTIAGDAAGDTGCATGQIVCGEACVDPSSDPANCGGCGTICSGATPVCDAGACAATCSGDRTNCSGACVDLQSDFNHCGACGDVCPGGATCESGACACPEGTEDCGDRCADLAIARDHCGTCGNACAPGASCDEGVCCGTGQTTCDGACVDLRDDPLNCGGCGVTCGSNQACSSGVCSDTCPEPLEICAGRCVDTRVSDDHCGGCNATCDPGEGCVASGCSPRLELGDPPAACEAGGPPIIISGGASPDRCAGSLAGVSFRWALCSCADIGLSNKLYTDGFNSGVGPYEPGGLGGGVGLNGSFDNSNASTVFGTVWSSGADGLTTSNDMEVKQDIHVGGAWSMQKTAVDGDGWVVGDITASNTSSLAGTLHHQTGATRTGDITFGTVVEEAVTVPPPCDCAESQLIDIAGIVDAHVNDNDNALIGLEPDALVSPAGSLRVDLPCGEYFLSGIDSVSEIAVVVSGNTAIYIEGDVDISNKVSFSVDGPYQLDVFIKGSLCVSNNFNFGSPNNPANTRFYVGGTNACGRAGDSVAISNVGTFAGNIYAPYGNFFASNKLLIYGGLFVGSFENSNETTIHYDRAVVEAGQGCPSGCPDGLTNCDGRCVDLQTDPENCGACGDTCPEGAICVDGGCQCPEGTLLCDGVCITPSPDACGACGTACEEPTPICEGGTCVGTCEEPNILCDGVCLDPSSDPLNCGGCGNTCPIGATCVGGACQCPEGQIVCDGRCVDPSSDPGNCGGCGVLCEEPTPTCEAGVCTGGDIGCSDCRDCDNQACNDGVCGACTTNSDCCSPLVCQAGECVLIFN